MPSRLEQKSMTSSDLERQNTYTITGNQNVLRWEYNILLNYTCTLLLQYDSLF